MTIDDSFKASLEEWVLVSSVNTITATALAEQKQKRNSRSINPTTQTAADVSSRSILNPDYRRAQALNGHVHEDGESDDGPDFETVILPLNNMEGTVDGELVTEAMSSSSVESSCNEDD
jgi:hypothetical protein